MKSRRLPAYSSWSCFPDLNQRSFRQSRKLIRARCSTTQQFDGLTDSSLQISSVSNPSISRIIKILAVFSGSRLRQASNTCQNCLLEKLRSGSPQFDGRASSCHPPFSSNKSSKASSGISSTATPPPVERFRFRMMSMILFFRIEKTQVLSCAWFLNFSSPLSAAVKASCTASSADESSRSCNRANLSMLPRRRANSSGRPVKGGRILGGAVFSVTKPIAKTKKGCKVCNLISSNKKESRKRFLLTDKFSCCQSHVK